MITGIHAGRLFAMAADYGKSGVFAHRCNTVILLMIEILTTNFAFLAFATNF
jgi:hypothetical protein